MAIDTRQKFGNNSLDSIPHFGKSSAFSKYFYAAVKRDREEDGVKSGKFCGAVCSAVVWGLGFALPEASVAAPASGRTMIVNDNSNLCLAPSGRSRSLNAEIVQIACVDNTVLWSFTIIGGNTVAITNLDSGLCLTVAGGGTTRNLAAVQYTCDSHPSRRWIYQEIARGEYRLMNVNSRLCLTVAGGSTGRNVTAVQYLCDGDRSRDWFFEPLP